MKSLKIAALVFAALTAWGRPAAAAAIDYSLNVPLIDAGSDDATPTGLLSGTLSYDAEFLSGTGTFSLVGVGDSVSGTFSGLSFLLALGDGTTGVLFDGDSVDEARLYFNIVASSAGNAVMSGPVNYCTAGCAMFNALGATLTPVALSTLPAGQEIAIPGVGVSPVPLPPAASLFGAALLALGGLGACRRRLAHRRVAATRG